MKKFGNANRVRPIWFSFLLISLLFKIACSGFSVAGIVPNEEALEAPWPEEPEPEYGKFVIYYVADGQIKTLKDDSNRNNLIMYHLGELRYKPSMETESELHYIYNIDHPCGDGYDLQNPPVRDKSYTIFSKDLPYPKNQSICHRTLRSASDHPESIVVNNQLYFYYTNYPAHLLEPTGFDSLSCNCPAPQGEICKVDGIAFDAPDSANGPNQDRLTLAGLNCYFKNMLDIRDLPEYDQDWIRIPVSQYGFEQTVPLRIRILGEQFGMKGARTIKLDLYETVANGVPDPNFTKPVASTRFGLDFSRMRDPVIGYMARGNRDYWLLITDWERMKGVKQIFEPSNYQFFVWVEATPTVPVMDSVGNIFDETAYLYRAGIMPARSGNPELNNGPSFEPDDLRTKVEDLYPDCDGIPDTDDEGDWGIYEICPVEGGGVEDPDSLGIRDGNMQWFEVDNKNNIDDGEYFHGVKTNLPSMGSEAPSVIQVGDKFWMFISTGSGIFQLSSHDGLNWDLSNLYQNRPSLLPRSLDRNAKGDPEAPVVSSGRYGYCESWAKGDDQQVVFENKGYPDTVCLTFGDDGYLDSYALADERALSNGLPIINSGADGVINTWFFPNCVSHRRPTYWGYFQLKTEAPGNPDLYCGDSVTNAQDESAFLLGDDQWATNAIGINPPEYWRAQNCNPFTMAEQFNQCALGGKSNAVAIVPGSDGKLQTASDFLLGDDHFCHLGDQVGICPGANGKFDRPGVEEILKIIKKVPVNDDQLCEISPALGLEYARFKYSDSYQLSHNKIIPESEIVVSWNLALYKFLANAWGWPPLPVSEILVPGTDYSINYADGEIIMRDHNWLQAIANLGFDPNFYQNPDSRKKDVLIVYYRYEGSQVGICPGPNNITDTPRYFYAGYYLPDRFITGPTLELSPTIASVFGSTRIEVPRLGDSYMGNVSWDNSSLSFDCPLGDCWIAPGSDNSLDSAWVLDGELSWKWEWTTNSYTWPPDPNNMANTMLPLIAPHRYDLYGHYDDWLCPIGGQWALCPGGNGYFQLYQLWEKVEVHRYEGIDDLLANYKKSDDPCYTLETLEEQNEFYESSELKYIQYAYRGVMQDDRVIWNNATGQYEVSTGTNGINQSCVSPSDSQLLPRYQGLPYQRIINPGANEELNSYPMKDNLIWVEVENERPLPKITSGSDGICNSFKIGDDRPEIFFGTGGPDYPCVLAGPNGYADTEAGGNDTQLYLPGEKTGFDSYQVDTPEIVKDGNKLYLYYSGLGWRKIPRSVPPNRGALASLGECKRPGLDNRWGNLSYKWSTSPDQVTPRSLLTRGGELQTGLYLALDDNQGVILGPRIGVAMSTVDRVSQNPSDWDRVLEPVIDAGGICQAMLSADVLSILGGLIGGGGGGGVAEDIPFPPIFNFMGSFSPEIFIKHNEADDTPIFVMFLNGIYMVKQSGTMDSAPAEYNNGLYKPEYQIGLARSIDGIHFDLANDINPLLVHGDLNSDLDATLGVSLFTGKPRVSFLNPTVFEGANDSYAMIFKALYPVEPSRSGTDYLLMEMKSDQEWLGFAVRSGAVYGGGIAGMISCQLNPQHLKSAQGWFRFSATALLLLPLAGLFLFKIWNRKAKTA